MTGVQTCALPICRLRLMVDFSCRAIDEDRTCPEDWDKGEWINFIRRVTDEDIDSYDNVGLAPFWAEHKPFVVILLVTFSF